MLVAYGKDDQAVVAGPLTKRQDTYFCPACRRPVFLKRGKIQLPHFCHYHGEVCGNSGFSEGETVEHLQGKLLLAEFFKRAGAQVALEAYLPKLAQRPDLLVGRSKRKPLAVEFQCSPVSPEVVHERTSGYLKAGFDVIWVGGRKIYATRGLSQLKCVMLKETRSVPVFWGLDVVGKQLLIQTSWTSRHERNISFKEIKTELIPSAVIDLPIGEETQELERINKKRLHLKYEGMSRQQQAGARSLFERLYRRGENIVTMPLEVYGVVPTDWLVQTFSPTWKYDFLSYVESYPKNFVFTLGHFLHEFWYREVELCSAPLLSDRIKQRPLLEFLGRLTVSGVLRRTSSGSWEYQKPAQRFKSLEEKLK